MFTSILLLGLTSSLGPPLPATGLAAIPRVIAKEPVYEGKPRYCLLVFGKDAKTRVWFVVDDKNHYVDFKGDGDLTFPGVRRSRGVADGGVTINQLTLPDGGRARLRAQFHGDGTFEMVLGTRGDRAQFVGIGLMDKPTWGDKPANAPVIHFDGPMSFERYGPIVAIPRGKHNDRRLSLRLMLGTPGLGKGTFASYDEICSENLGPVHAEIVYSHKGRPAGEMFRQSVELPHDG
jgi:hypothetical protein